MVAAVQEIVISPRSAVRVRRTEYCGRQGLDLRLWFVDDEGEWRPTRRGVRVDVGQGRELVAAIVAKLGQEEPD